MKKYSTRAKISTLTLLILLTMSIIAIGLPNVSAQEILNKKTYAICGVTPNPVGVNQDVLIHVGITDYLQITTDGWEGLTVTVTKPDATTETLGPFRTDSTGSTGTIYVPTMVGTYTFQTHFPATEYTFTIPPIFQPDLLGTTILYEASNSEEVELIVQTEPLQFYQGPPLPNEYWSRPIDAQHWEWSTISGNWVTTPPNMYAPNNDYAPETPHILWAKPLTTGGLVGGDLGPHAFDGGDAYEGKFLTYDTHSAIILAGKLYFNRYQSRGDFSIEKEVVAVDLRTGEELWAKNLGNNETLAFGQLFYWDSYNMHSSFEYLWTTDGTVDIYVFGFKVAEGVFPGRGSTWKAFDPFTGRWIYTMENVPSGQMIMGPKGEIYIYTLDPSGEWLTMWNSSRVVSSQGSWRPHGNTYDAMDGIEWNVTLPSSLPATEATPLSDVIVLEDRIIGSTAAALQTVIGDPPITNWGVSTKPGQEGELLFNTVWQPPAGDLNLWPDAASLEDGIFTIWSKEQRANYGFSIDTGANLWGPTESQVLLDIFGIENAIVDGKLFSVGMGGVVYAYDVSNGNRLWSYVATDPASEILWSNNWPLHIAFITDGKIYLTHSEHSVVDPKPRGAPFICLDVETGDVVWRIDGAFRGTDWGGRAIIADSIIVTYNTYDQLIYAIGKGPTETTVEIQNDVIKQGSSVLVKGTVTDVSSGTKDQTRMARFPSGVAAIADEYMGDWMKYVYMQFERPADAVGVPVKIQIVDPAGQYAWIGTTTSDSYGNYAYSFIPQIKGLYTIIATFDGSESYWGSTSITYLMVDPAPDPYPTVTIPQYPGYQGPTASEVAQNVVTSLPEGVSANDVAQEILTQMPEYPETPEYTTSDMIIIILVAVAIVIGIISFLVLNKKK